MIVQVLRFAWRAQRGRSGRVWLVVACLCLGVLARVIVGSAVHDVSSAVERESRTLVGADLIFSADTLLDDEKRSELDALLPVGSQHATYRSTLTMASRSDQQGARLSILKGVSAEWPLRGSVTIDGGDGPVELSAGQLPDHLPSGSIWVQQDLLVQLNLTLGEKLRLGQREFLIASVLVEEPGGGSLMMSAAPSIIMSDQDLSTTGLDGFASRVNYFDQYILPIQEDPQVYAAQIRERWNLSSPRMGGFSRQMRAPSEIRLRTAEESLASVDRFLNRFGDFLRFLSLLALLLGSIGVAHLVRGFVINTLGDHALLAVLGARPWRIVAIMVVQLLMLGLAGGLMGALFGSVLYVTAAAIFSGLVDLDLGGLPHGGSILWGVFLGVTAALVAGISPVLALRRIRPLAILRGELTGLPKDRFLSNSVLFAGGGLAVVVAAVETRSWVLGPSLIGGLVGVGLVIAMFARFILPICAKIQIRTPGIRHGLSNLGREGFRPTAAVVALGISACILSVMAVYRSSLDGALDTSMASRAPALFAIQIPNAEVEQLGAAAREAGASSVQSAPMVMARIRDVNGIAIDPDSYGTGREAERQQWALSREQRLSWREQLGPDEEIIAGRWMDPESKNEVSLSDNFAESAGLKLGDVITLDIQGVPISVTVTSIRRVDWLGFQLNFFMLVSPETLKMAPRQWVSTIAVINDDSAQSAAQRMAIQARLANDFPMVTTIDVAQQIDKAQGVIGRMAIAVVALSIIAFFAGLAVLVGICAASAHERRQDAALLRVCGARNGDLRWAVVSEFTVIGLCSASAGVALSLVASWFLFSYMLDFPVVFPFMNLSVLTISMVAVVVLTGLLATRATRHQPPLTVLREAG